MPNHGVIVNEQGTVVSSPVAVETGIPFDIGASPIQNAANPAPVGVPTLINSLTEFREKFGWSEDWTTYPLCEFAYVFFILYNRKPGIFVNLLDPGTHKQAVAAANKTVVAKKVELTVTAIDDAGLAVKDLADTPNTLVKDTDYTVYHNEDGKLVIELLPDSTHYSDTQLNVAYNDITPASVTAAVVATGLDKVDLCMGRLGLVPDILLATGYSDNSTVSAVMAAKAAAINGMFKAKALVDISTAASGGADSYDEVLTVKNGANLDNKNVIACWPLFKLGSKVYHASSQIAGVIATTDEAWGAPYASPSNKTLYVDSLVDAAGNEIILSKAQADVVANGGVITGLNFMGGFVSWGNYDGAYPAESDVKDTLICISRMFGWVNNTLIQTFWRRLDEPMTRPFIDSIVDSVNIWLNGLAGSGYLLGGRVEYLEEENPPSSLMQGIVKLHVYMTPPSPAQEIDFTLEYDASYVEAAFAQ